MAGSRHAAPSAIGVELLQVSEVMTSILFGLAFTAMLNKRLDADVAPCK